MDEKRFIKLFWVIKASLIIVLVYAGFSAVTGRLHTGEVFQPGVAAGDETPPEDETAPTASPLSSDYTAIVRGDLFGGADRPTGRPLDSARTQALNSLPSGEELGLKLVGAIAGGPAASRAIIQNARDNTISPYRIGDIVAAATVESIQRDAVVLRHEGRRLVLKLHTGTASEDKADPGPTTPQTAAHTAPTRGNTVPLSTQAGYVEEVFRKVKIEPYVKNKQTRGLKISGLEKVPLAEIFGLRNGDVIQTINGQQLTSKQKAFQVLMKARTQSRVDIQLLRDGKSKDLSFDI